MTYENDIKALRDKGLSYNEIVKELNCSKSLVCYYIGKNQKPKMMQRQRIRRKKHHPYIRKLEQFSQHELFNSKNSKQINTTKKLLDQKVRTFNMTRRKYETPLFTVEDILEKFGDKPKCYLTGEQLDINQPRTYEFDHIIPRSKGGSNELDNLGICTKQANRAKGIMTKDEFINFCKQVSEFNS